MTSLEPIKEETGKLEKEDEDDVEEEDNGNFEEEEDELEFSQLIILRSRQFSVRFLKGFASGLGVYTGVKIVTSLMKNPFRESLPKIRTEFLAKDSFKFAAFLGLYPSIYDLTVELLEHYRERRDDFNSAVAGGIAGLSMVVEDRTRRQIYCLFAIARAVGAMVTTLVKRGVIPAVPHSETALFCSCTSFLVYCTALKPQYLFTGYYRSVLKWSRDYTDQKLKLLFREPGNTFLTCGEAGLHDHNCTYHAFKDFLQSLPPFAKLYLPIHMAPIIFFRYKQFLKRPKQIIIALLKNVVWSTAFLATMVMLAKYGICLLRNFQFKHPPLSPWIPAVAGFIAGLGVLFERKNRRRELSLFLIPHTLYAVYLWAKETRIIKHVPHSSLFLFALAMVPIMHAYEREPESLNVLLHSALKFFVGKRQSTIERRKRRTVSEMSM